MPEMARNDSDIVYRMIAKNFVMYREPNDDLVFAAHKTNPTVTNFGQKSEHYYSDFPVSVVACGQQVCCLSSFLASEESGC